MKNICWVRYTEPPHLAVVALPSGDEWLEEDLARLKQGGIDVLVSLLMPDEAADLGLAKEGEIANRLGIDFISYPIPDRTTPVDSVGFGLLVSRLAEAVRAGKHVGAHCRGCIGRATVTTAAVLIQLGIKPADALSLIEEARGCFVPDTLEQLKWILSFEPAR